MQAVTTSWASSMPTLKARSATTDVVLLGRLSREALAAAAIGNTVFYFAWLIGSGLTRYGRHEGRSGLPDKSVLSARQALSLAERTDDVQLRAEARRCSRR